MAIVMWTVYPVVLAFRMDHPIPDDE